MAKGTGMTALNGVRGTVDHRVDTQITQLHERCPPSGIH